MRISCLRNRQDAYGEMTIDPYDGSNQTHGNPKTAVRLLCESPPFGRARALDDPGNLYGQRVAKVSEQGM